MAFDKSIIVWKEILALESIDIIVVLGEWQQLAVEINRIVPQSLFF